MITKEHEFKKYCCLYASDYHLEMILLPYIKNNIDKTNFIIFTETDLFESTELLLKKINLQPNDKEKILNLNWHNKTSANFQNFDFHNSTIIINGCEKYINDINKKIENLEINSINLIYCYEFSKKPKNSENFDAFLNTKKI